MSMLFELTRLAEQRRSLVLSFSFRTKLQLAAAGSALFLVCFLLAVLIPGKPKAKASSCSQKLDAKQLSLLVSLLEQSEQSVQQQMGSLGCDQPKTEVRARVVTKLTSWQTASGDVWLAFEDNAFVGLGQQRAAGPSELPVFKPWSLLIGTKLSSFTVQSSLGELSIAGKGEVKAPYDGVLVSKASWILDSGVEPLEPGCLLYLAPQLPSYAAKLCSLADRAKDGPVQAGQVLGQADKLFQFALLAQRGKARAWQYTEPSALLINSFVK